MSNDDLSDRVLLWYKQLGGYKEGHYVLSSGLHTDVYLQSALILKNPHMSSILGRYLALAFSDTRVHTILTAPMGGVIIGQDVARELCAHHIFTEREMSRWPSITIDKPYITNNLILRRGFQIEPNEKILIIEDVITTGRTTKELMSLVQEHLGRVVGVGAIVDRSDEPELNFGVPFRSLAKIKPNNWKSNECPLCIDGKPFVYEGSRK